MILVKTCDTLLDNLDLLLSNSDLSALQALYVQYK